MFDEQAAHDRFERLVGGPERGFRLLDIYRHSSASGGWGSFGPYRSREDNFRAAARARGYSDREIDALLALQ